jgi:hypothetical protein
VTKVKKNKYAGGSEKQLIGGKCFTNLSGDVKLSVEFIFLLPA